MTADSEANSAARKRVAIAIHPAGLADARWQVAGWLSVPPDHRHDLLLILVHGACYTHAYWDMPYRPQLYSCVEWAWARGLAVLNIDRLGRGESWYPPGRTLTMARNAEALHQIIGQARTSGIAGHRFSRCIPVGHSLGSLTAALMQASYGSADALVMTGWIGANVIGVADTEEGNDAFRQLTVPAATDPALQGRIDRMDADYFSMPPAVRERMFFNRASADPEMIRLDHALRDTITMGEVGSTGLAADAAVKVTAPVLVQLGAQDAFFFDPATQHDMRDVYAATRAATPDNFTFAPLYRDTGHNLAQHPNARDVYDDMAVWLDHRVSD